jgi:hypothetical protein
MNFLFFFFFFSVKKIGYFQKSISLWKNIQIFDVGFVHICIKKICLVGHIHEGKKIAWN